MKYNILSNENELSEYSCLKDLLYSHSPIAASHYDFSNYGHNWNDTIVLFNWQNKRIVRQIGYIVYDEYYRVVPVQFLKDEYKKLDYNKYIPTYSKYWERQKKKPTYRYRVDPIASCRYRNFRKTRCRGWKNVKYRSEERYWKKMFKLAIKEYNFRHNY